MRLVQWYEAIQALHALVKKHGHNSIPIPDAMAALNAESRSTFYRRLDDLRQAGWYVYTSETGATIGLLAPNDDDEADADEIWSALRT